MVGILGNVTHYITGYSYSCSGRFFVKFRPQLEEFLSECHKLFEMTVYTHGTRKYAEGVCKIMDPDGKYFGKRIVSRTDHPDLGLEKSLARLFLEDWSMAVVLDDREDVWKGPQQTHLVCVKPYIYFNNPALGIKGKGGPAAAGEINNASGMLSTAPPLVKSGLEDSIANSTDSGEAAEKSGDSSDCGAAEESKQDVIAVTPLRLALQEQEERDAACLLRSYDILCIIHAKYFNLPMPANPRAPIIHSPASSTVEEMESAAEEPDSLRQTPSPSSGATLSVGNILTKMRLATLRGCVICFSGVIPISDPSPQSHYLWTMATRLGATVSLALNEHTTHLLTTGSETRKALECARRGNVYICHSDWLLNCHWHVRREPETAFLLAPPPVLPVKMYIPPPRSESPDSVAGSDNSVDGEKRDGGGSRKRGRELRPAFSRSNAGEFGVSYNTDSGSDSNSSSDDEGKMRYKVPRTGSKRVSSDESKASDSISGDSSSESESGDDDWLKEMEEEAMIDSVDTSLPTSNSAEIISDCKDDDEEE